MPDGQLNEVKPVPAKARNPMDATPPRLVIEASEDAPSKQLEGTEATPDGQSNEVKPVPAKASYSMVVTLPRLVSEASDEASLKHR